MSSLQKKLLDLKKTLNKINNLNKAKSQEVAESEFNFNKKAIDRANARLAALGQIDEKTPRATKLHHETYTKHIKDLEDRQKSILQEYPELDKPKSARAPKSPYSQSSQEFHEHLKNVDPKDLPAMHKEFTDSLSEEKKNASPDANKIQDLDSKIKAIYSKLDYHKNKRPFLEMHDEIEKEKARRDRAYALGDAKTQSDAEDKISKLQDKIDLIPTEDLQRELDRHNRSMDVSTMDNAPLFNEHKARARRVEDQIERSKNWNTPERKERDAYLKQLEGLSSIDKNAALSLFDKEKTAKARGLGPSGTDKKNWKKPSDDLESNKVKFTTNEQDIKRQQIKQQEAKLAATQQSYEKEIDPAKKARYKNIIDNLSEELEDIKSANPIKDEALSDKPSKNGKQIGEKQRIVSQVGHNEDGKPHNVARIYSWEQGKDGKPDWQLKEEKSDDPRYHLSGHKMIQKTNNADLSDRSKYDENGIPVTQKEGDIVVNSHGDTHSYKTINQQNPTREDGQPNEIVRHFKFDGKDKKWKPVKDVSLSDLYNADGTKKQAAKERPDLVDLSDSKKYDEHGHPIFSAELGDTHSYKTINPLYPQREDGEHNVISRKFEYRKSDESSDPKLKALKQLLEKLPSQYSESTNLPDRKAVREAIASRMQQLKSGVGKWTLVSEEPEEHPDFHSDGRRKTKIEKDAELNDTIDRVNKLRGIDPKKNLSEQKPKHNFSEEERAKMNMGADLLSDLSPEEKADAAAQSNLLFAQKQIDKDTKEKQQKKAYDEGVKQLDPNIEMRRTGVRSDKSNMGQENQLISDEQRKQNIQISQPAMKAPSQVVQNPPKPKVNPFEQWKDKQTTAVAEQPAAVEKPKVNPFEQWKAKQATEVKKNDVLKIESLSKTLTKLKKVMNNSGIGGVGSVKAGAVLPNITPKGRKIGHNSLASKMKMPSATNQSKKDPMRSVQQIQNKDIKDLKMKEAAAALVPAIKFQKNGQWSLHKADEETPPPVPSRQRSHAAEGRTPGPNYWNYVDPEKSSTPRSTIDRWNDELEDRFLHAQGEAVPPPIADIPKDEQSTSDKKQRSHAAEGRTPGPSYNEYTKDVPRSTTDRWNDEYEANYLKQKAPPSSSEDTEEPLAASSSRHLKNKLEKIKKRCWKGYEPTPGKKPYSEDSCQPIKKEECGCKSETEKKCECDE